MEFVVNEWLPEYIKPNASPEEQEKLEKFLNRFLERNDKILVRRPSEFLRKILLYAKELQDYPKFYNNIYKFITIILYDSNRCIFVDDDDFNLEDRIRERLVNGGNTVSDTYLFEAASVSESKTIVTTDQKLINLMAPEKGFRVTLLDDFLANY